MTAIGGAAAEVGVEVVAAQPPVGLAPFPLLSPPLLPLLPAALLLGEGRRRRPPGAVARDPRGEGRAQLEGERERKVDDREECDETAEEEYENMNDDVACKKNILLSSLF